MRPYVVALFWLWLINFGQGFTGIKQINNNNTGVHVGLSGIKWTAEQIWIEYGYLHCQINTQHVFYSLSLLTSIHK